MLTKIFPILTTERLLLRQLEEADDIPISTLRSDESINKYIDRPKQSSIEEAKAFIKKISDGTAQGKSFYWAICLKNNPALIGTICLWNFSDDRTTAELGYELHPKFQGQGIMNEAVKSVIKFSFDTIKLKTLEAYTHKDNESSTRLLLKNNFKLDASKKDEYNTDYVIYILRNPS
jgi:ribosomal-protein-alanine N-acetyltransferase